MNNVWKEELISADTNNAFENLFHTKLEDNIQCPK